MALKLAATGLPQYHQARQWWTPGIVSGSGLGRQITGIAAKTFQMSFDRGAPAALVAQVGCFLNRDSEITATTYSVTAASNAAPIVVTIGTHTLVPGDTVVVAGVGGNTAANGTWTIVAVTSTTITLGGSAGNGAYTSGGTVVQTAPAPVVIASYLVTGATNASPIVVTIGAHALAVGDVVTIAGVGGNTAANGTWALSAVSGTTITLQGSTGNGAYTSGGTAEKIGWPALQPYVSSNTYIDLEVANASGVFATGWTGDNGDVRMAGIQFDNGATIDLFRPSPTIDLNQAWTKLYSESPSCSVDLKLILSNSAYLGYHRIAGIRRFRMRIMAVGDSPSGSTTTSGSASAGTNVVVSVASTTGFSVNDYVLLNDAANGKQCVGKVTAISAGVSLTIDTLDVTIASGSSVKNTAFELKVHQVDMLDAPEMADEGAVKVVNIKGAAVLTTSQTVLVTQKGYNDDGV